MNDSVKCYQFNWQIKDMGIGSYAKSFSLITNSTFVIEKHFFVWEGNHQQGIHTNIKIFFVIGSIYQCLIILPPFLSLPKKEKAILARDTDWLMMMGDY
tara:strand:+ start:121 stop:417 length:297 start_codon:yes stop_codon:yes gene_type:complete